MQQAEDVAERAKAVAQENRQGTIELTPEEITMIDLLLTKESLAVAEERLAAIQLKESQRKLMDVAKRRAVLLAKVGARVGGRIKDAKIISPNQLAYELE